MLLASNREAVNLIFSLFSFSFSLASRSAQSKLADSSDWPTLGSETTTVPVSKKDLPTSTSNSDLREKDKKAAAATNPRPKPDTSEAQPHVDKPKDVSVVETVASEVKAVAETNGPMSDANSTNDKTEVKNVPKAVDDGAKRVNAKPKWNRFEVETKSAVSSQNRRKTDRSPPRRSNRDDYYSRRDDDRSNRRGNSSRGTVPSSSTRTPRTVVAPVASATVVAAAAAAVPIVPASVKPAARGGVRREPAYITRSNRPSYTESKTPGLNGNPIAPMKSSDLYDAKKQKPLLARPIIIDASIAPLVATNFNGTFYFNGPTPFALDTIGNIKESIKKQM